MTANEKPITKIALDRYNKVKELLLQGKSPKEIAIIMKITPSYIYLYPELRRIAYENKYKNEMLCYLLRKKGLTYKTIEKLLHLTEITIRRRARKIEQDLKRNNISIDIDKLLIKYGFDPKSLIEKNAKC